MKINLEYIVVLYIIFRMGRYMFLAREIQHSAKIELYPSMYFIDVIVIFIVFIKTIINMLTGSLGA